MKTNKTRQTDKDGCIDAAMQDTERLPPSSMTVNVLTDSRRIEKESIHSGQFMVSHFEAEEAMDDLIGSEVKMLDPEDPSLLKADETNTCTEVKLYLPRNVGPIHRPDKISTGLITSHLEIETSLTKLFKCMNLAYSQKLTSPKWNHFKGVRLRWKDKIRLNNVIWRCWHMQFILKQKTPVCQFASPLDVDMHNNPQSVVLEGKYWKRQLTVIKAEYRKWRRNFISKNNGYLSCDSKSGLDFLDWSPLSERNLLLPDDWTSDTLFSAINVPFPFPDPREIARGAGIADFIQPSLGPLQPNLDDIDLTFAVDLLQNSRLPPVPEEGVDDMLKIDECGLSEIIGSDGIEAEPKNMVRMQHINNINMEELNIPLGGMQFANIDQQQFVSQIENTSVKSNMNLGSVLSDAGNMASRNAPLINCRSEKHYNIRNDGSQNRQNGNEFSGISVIKGRISKNSQRVFRREPRNYDKAQPTLNQTSIYQQMLAEQQEHHNSLQNLQCNTQQLNQASTFGGDHLQMQINYQPQKYTNVTGFCSPNAIDIEAHNSSNKKEDNIVDIGVNTFDIQESHNLPPTNQARSGSDLLSIKKEHSSSELHPMFSKELCENGTDGWSGTYFKANTDSNVIEKNASSGNYLHIGTINQAMNINDEFLRNDQNKQSLLRNFNAFNVTAQSSSLPTVTYQQQEQQTNNQRKGHDTLPKEMFRSNSLPLNASLNRLHHDNFTISEYHKKTNAKSRSRRNSLHQASTSSTVNSLENTSQLSQQLKPATSDPVLNVTLAQLLTNQTLSLGQQQISAYNMLSKLNGPLTGLTRQSLPPMVYPMSTIKSKMITTDPQMHQLKVQASPQIRSTSLPILFCPPPCGPSMTNASNLRVSPELVTAEHEAPLSPLHNMKNRDNQRRAGHIHAEQKRRYNIKNGFDVLHSFIPQLQHNSSAKLSKAAMLQKGADYIKQLRNERTVLQEKINALSLDRDALNSSLAHLQTILPANGAPLLRQRSEHVIELYEKYIRFRTASDWKFWILGLIMEPLLNSYTSLVSTASIEELRRTGILWVEQHCSLIDVRPAVSNKLKYLSMTTDLLSDPPSTIHEEVIKAINHTSGKHPNLQGT